MVPEGVEVQNPIYYKSALYGFEGEDTLENLVSTADDLNRTGCYSRYFVVTDEEYERYWRKKCDRPFSPDD